MDIVYFSLSVTGTLGGLDTRSVSDLFVMRRSTIEEVVSPRTFLMASIPRLTIPRLLQYSSATSSVTMPLPCSVKAGESNVRQPRSGWLR